MGILFNTEEIQGNDCERSEQGMFKSLFKDTGINGFLIAILTISLLVVTPIVVFMFISALKVAFK